MPGPIAVYLLVAIVRGSAAMSSSLRQRSRQGHLVPRDWLRHGCHAQHGGRHGCLHAFRSGPTWLAFANRNELRVLVEGDPRLFNQYGVILVNPARHPHVKAADARSFIDWLVSDAGQSAIAGFRIPGEQALYPNARPSRGLKPE